jgi:hypothetical protein
MFTTIEISTHMTTKWKHSIPLEITSSTAWATAPIQIQRNESITLKNQRIINRLTNNEIVTTITEHLHPFRKRRKQWVKEIAAQNLQMSLRGRQLVIYCTGSSFIQYGLDRNSTNPFCFLQVGGGDYENLHIPAN